MISTPPNQPSPSQEIIRALVQTGARPGDILPFIPIEQASVVPSVEPPPASNRFPAKWLVPAVAVAVLAILVIVYLLWGRQWLTNNRADSVSLLPDDLTLALNGQILDGPEVELQVIDVGNKPVAGAVIVISLQGEGRLSAIKEYNVSQNSTDDRNLRLRTNAEGSARFSLANPNKDSVLTAQVGKAAAILKVVAATPSPTPPPVATVEPTEEPTPNPPPQPRVNGTLMALRDGAGVTEVAPGDEVTFLLTIRNDGQNPVDGVNVICDPVAATQYVTGMLAPAEGGGETREVLQSIQANSTQQTSLTLKVDDNARSDSSLTLKCRLEIPGLSQALELAPLVLTVRAVAANLQISIEPAESIETGIGTQQALTVRAVNANGEAVPNIQIQLSLEPGDLAALELAEGATSAEGALASGLIGSRVGGGKLVATVAGTEVSAEIAVHILPVAVVTSDKGAKLRKQATTASSEIGSTPQNTKLAILGKNSSGERVSQRSLWWQVRTLDKGTPAWVHSSLVRVEGDTNDVLELGPAATPALPPTETTTPLPATPSPTSTVVGEGDQGYPAIGAYALQADAGQGVVSFYRVSSESLMELFALPAGGGTVTVLKKDELKPGPPAGYVLVRLSFWVKTEHVETLASGWALKNAAAADQVCWNSPVDATTEDCGRLNANIVTPVPGSGSVEIKPVDWQQVAFNAWLKRDNLGAIQE